MPRPHRLPSLNQRNGSANSIKSRYTSYFSPRGHEESVPQLQRSKSEECIKCMLKMPHTKCEAHKYIRIGGGYRHSYAYVKAMLEELELQRQKELLLQQRLEAIKEGGNLRAIKTYIRTKSGRIVERMVFLTEEDYLKFKEGGANAEDILKKYLTKEEGANLQSWEKEEQKAVITYIRTKSGRKIQKIVYVSKDEYEAMKRGDVDANAILKKYLKPEDGETIEGWGEAEMKAITTFVRTKSGRLIEKTIMVSKEDYEKLQQLQREGKDPASILGKYMSVEEGSKIEGWKKNNPPPMKVVKAFVRTKSGRLVEKTILMTEEEYKAFQAAGGDPKALRKYLNLGKDDVIEDWEKASTVYADSDDEEALANAIPGSRIVGKDGHTYEVVIDPITGKKYKKRVGKESDADSGFSSLNQKKGKGKKKGPLGYGINEEDPNEKGMTKEEVAAYRAGKRRDDSDSEYSYRSVISAGGTRHVKRRRKRADGTYSDEESYHSDQDEAGKLRRQKRRAGRKAAALKEKKERFNKGKRNNDSDSEYSYRSVVSAGGTRHVKRRRKRADGTYSDEESYHSSQDEEGMKRRKKRREKRKQALKEGKRNADSDSDYSYRSVISAGGTRHVKRRRKRKDGTYSDEESYHSEDDVEGKERRRKRRQERQKAFKQGKRNADSDSEYSYRSVISAGGTRHVKRRRKRADGTYSAEESYHSSQDEEGQARRRRRRRDRKHAGSAHSYYSVVSEGGTRHVRRKRKNADGTYGESESYHSSDSDFFEEKKGKKKKKRREHGSDSEYSYYSEVSAGGTRHRKRKKRIRDAQGKVIGHGKAEDYTSPDELPVLSTIRFKRSIVSKRSLAKNPPWLYMKGKAYGPRNAPQNKWKISPNGPKSSQNNALKYQYVVDYEDSDFDVVKDFSRFDEKIKQKLLFNQMGFRPLKSPTDEAIQQLVLTNQMENQNVRLKKEWDSPSSKKVQDISMENKYDFMKLKKSIESETDVEVQQILMKNQEKNKYDVIKLKKSLETDIGEEIQHISSENRGGNKYDFIKLRRSLEAMTDEIQQMMNQAVRKNDQLKSVKGLESPTDQEVQQILSPKTNNTNYIRVADKVYSQQLTKKSPLVHNFKEFETYHFHPTLPQQPLKQVHHKAVDKVQKKKTILEQIQEFLKTANLPCDYYLPSYYDIFIPAYGIDLDGSYRRFHMPSLRTKTRSESAKYYVGTQNIEHDKVRNISFQLESHEKLTDYDKGSKYDAVGKPREVVPPGLLRGKKFSEHPSLKVFDKHKKIASPDRTKQELKEDTGATMETMGKPSVGPDHLKVFGKIWKKFHKPYHEPKEEKSLFLEREPYQNKPYQFRTFDQFVKHIILKKPKPVMDSTEWSSLREKYDDKPYEFRHVERDIPLIKKADKKQPKESLYFDYGKYKEAAPNFRDVDPSKPTKKKTREKDKTEETLFVREPYDSHPEKFRDLDKDKLLGKSPDTSKDKKSPEKESLYLSQGEYKQKPHEFRTLDHIKEKDKQKQKSGAGEEKETFAKDSYHDRPYVFRKLSREKLIDSKHPSTLVRNKKHTDDVEALYMDQGKYSNIPHQFRDFDPHKVVKKRMKISPREEDRHKRDVYDDHQVAFREVDKDKAWDISQRKKKEKGKVQKEFPFFDPGEYKSEVHQFRELDPNAPINKKLSRKKEHEEKTYERLPFAENKHEFREVDKSRMWDITRRKSKGSDRKLFMEHGEYSNTPYQYRDLEPESPKGKKGSPKLKGTDGQREIYDGSPTGFRRGETKDKRYMSTYENYGERDDPLGYQEKVLMWDDSHSIPGHRKNKELEIMGKLEGHKDFKGRKKVRPDASTDKDGMRTERRPKILLEQDGFKDHRDSTWAENYFPSDEDVLDYDEKCYDLHHKNIEKEKARVLRGSSDIPGHVESLESPERRRDTSPATLNSYERLSIVVDDYTKLYPLRGQHIYSPLEMTDRLGSDDEGALSDADDKIPDDAKKLSVDYGKQVRYPRELKSFDTFLHAKSSHKPNFLYQGRTRVSLLQIRARSLTVKDEEIFKKKFAHGKRRSSPYGHRPSTKPRPSDGETRQPSEHESIQPFQDILSKLKLTKEDLIYLQGARPSLKQDTYQPMSNKFWKIDDQRPDSVHSPIQTFPKQVKINLTDSMKDVFLAGHQSHIMPPEEYRRHLKRKSYEINREEIAKHHVPMSVSHSALHKSPEPNLYMSFGEYEDPKYIYRDLDKGNVKKFSFSSSPKKKDVFMDHGKYQDPKTTFRQYDSVESGLSKQSNADIKKKDETLRGSKDYEKGQFKDLQKQSTVNMKVQKSGIKVREPTTDGLIFMDHDQYKDPKHEFREFGRWTTQRSPDKDVKSLDKHDAGFMDQKEPQKQGKVDVKTPKAQLGTKVKEAVTDGLLFMDREEYKDPKFEFRDYRRWTTHGAPLDKHDSAFMDYTQYKDLKSLHEFKSLKPALKKSTEGPVNDAGPQRSSVDSHKLGKRGKSVSFIEIPQISKAHEEIESVRKANAIDEDTSPYLYKGEYSDPNLIDAKVSTSLSSHVRQRESVDFLEKGTYDEEQLEYRDLAKDLIWDISQPGEEIWRFPDSVEEKTSHPKLRRSRASFHRDSSLMAHVTLHERSNSSDFNLIAEKLSKEEKSETILTPMAMHYRSDISMTAKTEQGLGTSSWTNLPHVSYSVGAVKGPSNVDEAFTPGTEEKKLSPVTSSMDVNADMVNQMSNFSIERSSISHLDFVESSKNIQPQPSDSGFSMRKKTIDTTLSNHEKIHRILQVKGLSTDVSNTSVPHKFGTKHKWKRGFKEGKVAKRAPKIKKIAKILQSWKKHPHKTKKEKEKMLEWTSSMEETSTTLLSPIKESEASSYEYVSDGKGGKIRVKKEKKKGKKGRRHPDEMTDFSGSLASTDSEDEPDLSKMTEEEKKAYFEAKAKRKAEREKKRREKYGDKYDEMMEKHKLAKQLDFIEELQDAFERVESLDDRQEVSLLTEQFLRKVKKFENAPFTEMVGDLIAILCNPTLRFSTNPLLVEMLKMSDQLSLIEDIKSDLNWNDSITAMEQLMDELEEDSKKFKDPMFDGIISNLAWTVCDPEPRAKDWDTQFENAKDHIVRPHLFVLSEMRQAIGVHSPSEKEKMHRSIKEQTKKLSDPMIKAMVQDLIKMNRNPKKRLEEVIHKYEIVEKYAGRVDPLVILDDLYLLTKSTKNPLVRKHLAQTIIQKANGLEDTNFKALVMKTIKLVCDPNVSSEEILTMLAQVRRYSKRKSTLNFLDDLKYLLEDNDNTEEMLEALKKNGSKITDPGFQAIYKRIIEASNDPETSPEEIQKLFDEARGFAMRTLPISLIEDAHMILETEDLVKREQLAKAIMDKAELLSDETFKVMVEKLVQVVCDPDSSKDQIRISFENTRRYAASMEEQTVEEIKEKFDFLRKEHILTEDEQHEIDIRRAASYMADILLEINGEEIKSILRDIGDSGAKDVLEFLGHIVERLDNLEVTMESIDKCLDMCLNYVKGITSPEKFREFLNSQAKLLTLKEKMDICKDTIKDDHDRAMFVALLKESQPKFFIELEAVQDPLAKEAKKAAKSMVSYQKGKGRKGSEGYDDRSIGLAHEEPPSPSLPSKASLGAELKREIVSPVSSDDEGDKKKLIRVRSARSKSLPSIPHKEKVSFLPDKKGKQEKSVEQKQEQVEGGAKKDREAKVDKAKDSAKEDKIKEEGGIPVEEAKKQEEEIHPHELKAKRKQKLRRAIEELNRRRVAPKISQEEVKVLKYTVTEVKPKTIYLRPIRIPYRPSFEKKSIPVLPVFTDSTETVEFRESVKSLKSVSQPSSLSTLRTTSPLVPSPTPSLETVLKSYQKSTSPEKVDRKRWKRMFLPKENWGGKKKGRKTKDGHEGDDESDEAEFTLSGRRRKKKGAKDDDEESLYEYVRDKDGNVVLGKDGKPLMKKIGTVKKGKLKPGVDPDDSDYEFRYDKDGNLVRKKRGEKIPNTEFKELESDEELFETLPDGTIRLKPGKKKIDLSKLTDEELKKLGLDPKTMTKEQMARILKEKFGADIEINLGGKKVGLKALADFGSDANTDDLADDSDLDTSTLRGARRIRVLMKRGGEKMKEHMKSILENAALVDPHPEEKAKPIWMERPRYKIFDSTFFMPDRYAYLRNKKRPLRKFKQAPPDPEEEQTDPLLVHNEAAIQFLEHYKLVDNTKLEPYIRAFVVEDEDMDGLVYPRQARIALEGVPFIQGMSEKQMDYVFTLLDIDRETGITFRMFAVMSALCERVTAMDQHCKKLIEVSNLADIERKMALYREMFYCNVKSDRDSNYITSESLKIELIAGGLSWPQQEYVMEKMEPNEWREISFLDYLSYIPLFMSMHEYMCDNPLDMSNNKYGNRPHSPPQRDSNPLGFPLKKNTRFNLQQYRAKELKKSAEDMLGAKKKLPSIKSSSGSGFKSNSSSGFMKSLSKK